MLCKYNVRGLFLSDYCCPECSGTAVIWRRQIKKAVCPRDNTPVTEFLLKTI